ncbi:MAG TPA: AvrD family protein [Streptosporangiaceae bacterium]|nr:AvrD family protein [Streptosporangiaceae bacterium]
MATDKTAEAAEKATYSSISSIDDVLGPGEERFFGAGFKRAEHSLTAVQITGADGVDRLGSVAARAAVGYPADWSRKAGIDQRPHLSTIDVIVIGAQLSEMLLAHAYGVDRARRRRMVLRRIHVKAGTRPVEDDLSDFPAAARVIGTRPVRAAADTANTAADTIDGAGGDAAIDLYTTITECTVGTLRVRLEIRHEMGRTNPAPGFFGSPDELLGDARLRLFGAGYKAGRQLIENIDVDSAGHAARACVRMLATRRPTGRADPGDGLAAAPGEGLEATHRAAASPIDGFVIGLQLGQLLLYELDRVPRARSNTLWMRETVIDLDLRRRPLPALAPTTAVLDQPRLLENSKGEKWRCADIVGEFQGIRLRCSVAHRLP